MSRAYKDFKGQRYFGSLDGLRAISIAAVIWHHSASKDFGEIALLGRGYYGVELFFAISGFLIVTLLLREKEIGGTISLPKFYLRRTLRIFPLFYTVLLTYVVLVYFLERPTPYGMAFFDHLPYFATYTSNWFVSLAEGRNIFYYAWSLATEEQFYLVWPWVERFLKGRGAVITMLCVIVLDEVVQAGFLSFLTPLGSLPYRIISSIATPICVGVLLAHLLHNPKGFGVARRIFGHRWSSIVAFVIAAIVVGTPLHESTMLIGSAMALLVATCVIREDHYLAGILGSKPFRHIGMVSYGMYLWHMLAIHAFVLPLHLGSPVLVFVLSLLATVGVATLSFKYYESRFLRLKDRFASINTVSSALKSSSII